MLTASEEAAAIVAHYLRALTERSGLRWTAANDRDMDTLAGLLGQVDTAPELDSIPPYELPIVNDRVTQVFERDPVTHAAELARAGRARYDEADDVPVRRMLRREERRR